MVDNRSQQYFGRDSNPPMFAYHSPSAPVSKPMFSYSSATESAAPASGITVSDLQPAAGTEPAATTATNSQQLGTISTANTNTNTVQPFGSTQASQPLEGASAAAEPAPVNQWTGKERAQPVELTTSKPISKPAAKTGGYIWPVSSRDMISTFGKNDGINIKAAQGEPVWAVADGEVVYADDSLKGYGNMVLIKHSGGKTTTYAHLARMSVDKYDRVKQGDILGYVGSTGNVKAPQLYFSMRDGSNAVDPQKYLNRDVAGL